MKLLKRTLVVILAFSIVATCFACNSTSGGGNEGGGDDAAKVKTISSSILDGKIANFMGADGVGIVEKSEQQKKSSGTNPFVAVVHAESSQSTQKKSELVKSTDGGFLDVCFHESDGNQVKSYKDLNNKYEKHHHDTVECTEVDCDKISDEILSEENSGVVDTVLSLDARVNKLYTVGNFTFMSISSAVEGSVTVLTQTSMQKENFSVMADYPTFVNTEDNFDKGYTFSYIQINNGEKSGMIPVKVKESEENYHKINYWSDDFNQSFIIDNSTGITYSLSQFKYIYSVDGGLIKVCDQNSVNGSVFDYYKPITTDGEISFVKIEIPQGFYGKTHIDIYGNTVFESNKEGQVQNFNPTIETKVDEHSILSTKNQECVKYLENKYGKNAKEIRNYLESKLYHVASDGRIYRVNYLDDMTNVSVKVLNENCEWQDVENTTDVEFYLGYISTVIGVKVDRWNAFSITAIKNGNAYYSTAAHSDNFTIWERVWTKDKEFCGVVKMPVNGFSGSEQNPVKDFAQNFTPLAYDYSVVLVGSKQMLYITSDKVVLRDVETGEEKAIDVVVPDKGCAPDTSGSLYINGLGYIRVEKEIKLSTFGRNSFSNIPVEREVVLDGYYKLITSKIKQM